MFSKQTSVYEEAKLVLDNCKQRLKEEKKAMPSEEDLKSFEDLAEKNPHLHDVLIEGAANALHKENILRDQDKRLTFGDYILKYRKKQKDIEELEKNIETLNTEITTDKINKKSSAKIKPIPFISKLRHPINYLSATGWLKFKWPFWRKSKPISKPSLKDLEKSGHDAFRKRISDVLEKLDEITDHPQQAAKQHLNYKKS